MGSSYLDLDEYAAFGVADTTADKVTVASGYIDGWLKRPEGLIWTPDTAGNPAYMAALNPSYTLALAAPISPGTNIIVAVSGPFLGVQVGDALILDRADPTKTEAVVVVAKTPTTITLGSVVYPHSSGAKLDAGLAIIERRDMPKARPHFMVKRFPVQRILSGKGRYAYSRRGDAPGGSTDEFNLLAVYSQFGGPPAWELFNPASTEFDPRTGDVWVPAGIMLAYYTEVELAYVAGFAKENLPSQVKGVCAQLINILDEDPGIGPVKSYRAGDTAIEKFSDTLISGDMAMLLQPYRARTMG